MAFIAGIVNPKRIDYDYAGKTANEEEAAGAAVVDNGAEATADGEGQAPDRAEAGNTEAGNDVEAGNPTDEATDGTEEAATGSGKASDSVSPAEADTPIKRGRKPSKKA